MLSEKFVQRKALNFLKRRYLLRSWGKVLAQKEVTTRPKYGSKRADGLLIFRHIIWGKYVVSMEAKSRKTLAALRPVSEKRIHRRNSLRAGLLIVLASGSILTIYKLQDGFWQYLIPVLIFLFGSWAYGWITRHSGKHQDAAVFKQLGQYPANEQWVAVSKDAIKALPKAKRKALYTICRRRGVGLIIVNSIGFTFAKIRPTKKSRFTKYAKFYRLRK